MRSCIIYLSVLAILSSCNKGDVEQAEQKLRMAEIRDQLMIDLGTEYNQVLLPGDSLQIVQGEDIYMKLCASCHGETGQGDGWFSRDLKIRPTDFTDRNTATFYSDNGRLQLIRKGINNTSMKNWEMVLSEPEMLAVFLYLRSLIIPDFSDETR